MLGIVCSSRAIGQVNSIYVWSMREAGLEARAVHDNYDSVDFGIMVRLKEWHPPGLCLRVLCDSKVKQGMSHVELLSN